MRLLRQARTARYMPGMYQQVAETGQQLLEASENCRRAHPAQHVQNGGDQDLLPRSFTQQPAPTRGFLFQLCRGSALISSVLDIRASGALHQAIDVALSGLRVWLAQDG